MRWAVFLRRLLAVWGVTTLTAAAQVPLRVPISTLVEGVAVAAASRSYEPQSLVEALDAMRLAGTSLVELQAGQRLSPDDPDAVVNESMTEDQMLVLRRKLSTTGMTVVAARVRFSNNSSANTRLFEWADRLEIRVLVGEPPSEQIEHLEKMVRRFNIAVAIAHAGPGPGGGRGWSDPKRVMNELRGKDPRFGLVMNVLHAVRSGLDPLQLAEDLRTRLIGVQVTDVRGTGAQARAVPFGEGEIDFRRLLAELDARRFDGYVSFEWPAGAAEFGEDLARGRALVEGEMRAIRKANLLRSAGRSVRPPRGFRYDVLVQGDLAEPTHLERCPDGSLWVAGRRGTLWAWSPRRATLDVVALLNVSATGERGLFSFAFDPAFLTNGHVYVYWSPLTATGDLGRVSRFTAVTNAGSWQIAVETERVLLDIPSAAHGKQQGGGLLLHPRDGMLYIGTGDNNVPSEVSRFYDDPGNAPQNLADLRGKILRIGRDGSVPADNPFVQGAAAGTRPEVYAYGLRNPFSLSCDPETGAVFIGDVGFDRDQDEEEINLLAAGANYGWPRCDGRHRDTLAGTPCPLPEAVAPWHSYEHQRGASVLVGPVIRGGPPPGWPTRFRDGLVYGDFTRRILRFAQVDPGSNRVTNTLSLGSGFAGGTTSMALTPAGELYLVEYAGHLSANPEDRLSRLVPAPAPGRGGAAGSPR